MKMAWLSLVFAILATACTRQHPCREGTVFLSVVFSDDQSLVDGLALSYSYDSGTEHALFPPAEPLPRPEGKSRGGLELKVNGYAEKRLVLKFAPTKNRKLQGAWRTEVVDLKSGCTAYTLNVAVDGSDSAVGEDSSARDVPPGPPDVPVSADGSSVERSEEGRGPTETHGDNSPDLPEKDLDREASQGDGDARDRDDVISTDTTGQGRDARRQEDYDGGCDPGAPPQGDPLNCGACGNRCSSGDLCSSGHCCPAGSAWCATEGGFGCIDITFNSQNCGSCGRACPVGGTECCKGDCKYIRDYAHDTKNCGVCGNVCPKPSDSSDSCLFFGECMEATCGANYNSVVVCNPV